jgi:DNA modification methylase
VIRIMGGDCRALLRTLPDLSVHLCMTSPPFFGLRKYPTEPLLWGGDTLCEHDFQIERISAELPRGLGMAELGERYRGGGHKAGTVGRIEAERAWCSKCSCWRGHLGLEPDYLLYLDHLMEIFDEVWRVLRDDGTLWVDFGDAYASDGGSGHQGALGQRADRRHTQEFLGNSRGRRNDFHGRDTPGRCGGERGEYHGPDQQSNRLPQPGIKAKELMLMPARFAIAMSDRGWYVRKDNIIFTQNPMPESCVDRTTSAHRYLFHFSKRFRYFYDRVAIMEPSSPDSHARAARSRSDDHKWANGGPGNQTIAKERPVAGTYMRVPSGWDTSNERGHRDVPAGRYERPAGVNPKAALPYEGPKPKQNANYSEALGSADLVPMRNKRSVWPLASEPYKDSHFAVMPTAEVEPVILAGTSARGCCTRCGAPWERITSSAYVNPGNRTTNGPRSIEQRHETAGFEVRLQQCVETLGWYPTCGCDEAPKLPRYPRRTGRDPEAMAAWERARAAVDLKRQELCRQLGRVKTNPAVVLDPFAGAFTVPMVADRLQRDAIGLELSDSYVTMGRNRLIRDGGLLTEIVEGP